MRCIELAASRASSAPSAFWPRPYREAEFHRRFKSTFDVNGQSGGRTHRMKRCSAVSREGRQAAEPPSQKSFPVTHIA